MKAWKHIVFLTFFMIFISSSFAFAKNSVENIRYLLEQTAYNEQTEHEILRIVQSNNPVYLYFSADEQICKEKYGKKAYEICNRSFQTVFPDTEQIKLTPQIEGKWEWTSDTSLVFYPAKEWQANTKYSVEFGKEALPQLTVITQPVTFTTQALKPEITGTFKFDPEHIETMMIAGSIVFNYKVKEENVKAKLHVVSDKAVSLGQLETNFHNNTVYFSVPVLKVSDKAQEVKIELPAGLQAENGGKLASALEYVVKIPPKNEIFNIVGGEAGIENLPNLSVKQNIIVEFSLPVLAKQFSSKNIQAVLLPRDKVQVKEGDKNNPPYTWWSFAEITSDVLKKSEPLKLNIMNSADETTRFLMLAPENDIEAGRSALVTFSAPIQGPAGFVIDKEIRLLVHFKSLDSTVKIMQKGSLLSLHGDKKLSLYARNADKLHYTVRQIRPEFINSYVPLLRQAQYDEVNGYQLDAMSIVHEGDLPLAFINAEKAQFSSLDLAPYVKNDKGFFHVTVTAQKGDNTVASDARFIMLSDLGLIVKADENEEHVKAYLMSLPTGKPIGGATIEVLGANGIALFSGKTDRSGIVILPSLQGYEREKQVTAITASYKDDMAVLPYVDYQFALRPQNKINTSGKIFSEKNLNGFIFTQRDIYRAGETAYFGFILKQGDFGKIALENVPLTGTVYASNGQIISKQKMNLSSQGMGEFSCKLPDNAVSGVYNFQIEKADTSALLVSKEFHVMDFTPDTIKAQIANSLESKKYWYSKEDLQNTVYTVTVQNLFGSPAINNTVKAKLITSPMRFSFDGEYSSFKFYDASKADKTNVQELGSVTTDARGKTQIKLDTSALGDESLAVTMQAEAMDAQGGSSITVKDVLSVSPLAAVVGYKTQSNLDFLTQNEKASLAVIALDALAKPYAMGELALELYDSELVKSLVKVDGKYQYTKVRREKLLSENKIKFDAKVLDLSLDTTSVGDKLLVLKDKEGKTLLQVRYTVVGDSQVQFNEYKSASLQAIIDTKEYQAGENIKIALKTPYEGMGLITLERDKVFAEKWFRAKKGDSVQYIEIPKNLEGKAYLNVLYFRNIDDKEIFVEPCASVVLPFSVDISKRKLDVQMKIGNGDKDFVARPGQDLEVSVQTNEAAKVLVYAVDEGITRLTNYTCPNPLKELFLNRALSVQTYQYLDMLMPEFSLMQKELAKFGGGETLMMAKMANAMRDAGANPFKVRNHKSAVYWSGLLDVDKKGKTVKIPVPDTYNGNLRIFAVACSDTKVNAVQKDVYCQAEVIIQPHVPAFVSPQDEFEATLLLTDMRKNKSQKNMELSLDFGNAFEIIGKNVLALTLEEDKQNKVDIRVKVKNDEDVLGEKTLTFTVQEKKSGLKVIMPVELSVRPSSTLYSSVELGMLAEKNSAYDHESALTRSLYPQFASVTASVSSAPIPYVQALLQRDTMCWWPSTMQRVAKVMPLLYLLEHKEYAPRLENFEEEAIRTQILECLKLLESRHNYRDVFYRFEHYGVMSTYELSFILDFLTTAREKGIAVPGYLFTNVLEIMQRKLVQMPKDLSEARAIAYGAWGLTRNGIITSQIMANLTTWLQQNAPDWEQDIVASLMAGSMKLMMQDELADMFIAKYDSNHLEKQKYFTWFDGLSERALYFEIVTKHFAERLNSEKTQQIMQELYSLLQEYFAPSSEALAIRAIIENGSRQEVQKTAAKLAFLDEKGKNIAEGVTEEKNEYSQSIKLENSAQITAIKTVQIEADTPLFYQVSVTGYDKNRFVDNEKQAFAITREFRDADGNIVKDFHAGDEIVVAVKGKSLTGKAEQVMITDILPAAFEFVSTKSGEVESFRTMQGKLTASDVQENDMQVEFADRQEDRAFLFATLENRETVFRYKVRVGSKGNFVLPDITAQSVENALLYARDLSINDTRIIAE